MRQHLLKAFQDKELTPFPHKKLRQQAISIIEKRSEYTASAESRQW